MRVPVSWLKEFVDVTLGPRELAERMTFAGLEVSEVQMIGDFWDREKIVVGEITSVEPHPNADRLTIPTVRYGDGRSISVVTGAPNIKIGQSGIKVPLALVGSRLVNGHGGYGSMITLKPATLRGIASEGMICSSRELGISDEHEGIMVLAQDAPVGMPLADYLGDAVLDIDLTPNLSRCLSILGVAREVAALTGQKVRYGKPEFRAGHLKADDLMNIRIEDPELCARYVGTYIGNVSIGPSPFLVGWRLALVGVRSINNVVDATNYVMFELGQPLHAFDYQALRERAGDARPEIIIRPASPGEKIVTLDGVERTCTGETLLIADGRGGIAVAGVMGGLETEVREDTTEILLESANFMHACVRRTTQRFKLPSQASLRFGKGLPASLAGEASHRATGLIADLTGGEAAHGAVDNYPRQQPAVNVLIDHNEFTRLLGYHLPERKIFSILESLDFSVTENQGIMSVDVPEHRLDVNITADLVEEVARVEGYDQLPATLMKDYLPPQAHNPGLETEENIRDLLTAEGLDEVINYSLGDESRSRKWVELWEPGLLGDIGDFMRVSNPLSEDRTTLRVSLIPELLENLSSNRRFLERVAIFELGRVFHPAPGEERPMEPRRLGIILWGLREDPWWGNPEPDSMNFFDLKGVVVGLLRALNVNDVVLDPSGRQCLQEGRGLEMRLGERWLGYLGELSSQAAREFDLGDDRIAIAEIDLGLLAGASGFAVLRPPSRFPAVTQDLALVVDEDLPAEEVEKGIRKAAGDLLAELTVFDMYRGPQVPEGKKSVAFTLRFQAHDRTLTEEEASRKRDAIVRALSKNLGAKLR